MEERVKRLAPDMSIGLEDSRPHIAPVAGLILLALSLCLPLASVAIEADEQFSRALASRDRGLSFEAIKGFQAVLAQRPDSDRARAELAVAYLDAGLYEQALSIVNHLLERPGLPQVVRVNLELLKNKVGATKVAAFEGRKTWRNSASLRVGYDDNINLSSDEYFDPAFLLPLLPGLGLSTPREDQFYEGDVKVRFTHRNVRATDLFGRPLFLGWRFGSILRVRKYDQYQSQDQTNIQVRFSPGLRWQGVHHASVDFDFKRWQRGGASLADYIVARPHYTYNQRDHAIQIGLEFGDVDYLQTRHAGYSGDYTEAFVRYRRGWSQRLQTGVGLSMRDREANFSEFGYDSMQLEFSVDYRVRNNLDLSLSYLHREYDYGTPDIDFPTLEFPGDPSLDPSFAPFATRRDKRDLFRLLATFHLNTNWSIAGSVERSSNRSTFQDQEFDRMVATVGLVVRF